ncbi:hypothetical protein K7X08_038093 [Anisodus acutangulus]|uniref:non-specific serine/threonine protein kinase n=1 Tax=Anisodus acutangulus TaxID=402998 RepID=A0A9Q1RSN2_9SOLA|nr:hypothetical protein K7X08_038093 [Anisodus acutangulus]
MVVFGSLSAFKYLVFLLIIIPSVTSLSFNFDSFKPNDQNVTYERDAYPANDAIQLTTNQLNRAINASIGRATHLKPLHLWDKASGNVTDFSTHFSISINSQGRARYGDGFAFFLAPAGSRIPDNTTRGGTLSLTSNTQRLNTSGNHFVAVEFDTYQNVQYDPMGDHVGIDINSMQSVVNVTCMRFDEEEVIFDGSMTDEFERSKGPKKFLYSELARCTNNFAQEEMLGQGGFGGVYKGYIREMNSYIAVKRVSRESKQGVKEYASEVRIISGLRHKHLVQLIGWCHERRGILLVYEFMPNGSLDTHLFKGKSHLTWPIRFKIVQGLASALLYLHEEWEQCAVHRDIKSSNIMLDSNFNAKLGDFGLARLVDHEKGSQTTVLAASKCRPSIRQAIHVLNFEAPLPTLPPNMPVPTYCSPSQLLPTASLSSSYEPNGPEIILAQIQHSVNKDNTDSSYNTTASAAPSYSISVLYPS